MATVLGLLAILAPLVLAAIMIQARAAAELAIAKLNERVFALSRRCDVMQDTLDRYHAALMESAERRVQSGMPDEYTMAEVRAVQPVLRVRRASATDSAVEERGMCSLCDQVQPDSIAAICTSAGCPRRREYDAGVRIGGAS